MRKFSILFCFIFFNAGVALSQAPTLNLLQYLGGSESDYGQFVTTAIDGNLIFIGTTSSANGNIIGAHGGSDIWVAKLSTSGAILWQRTLGGTGDESAVSYYYNTTDGSIAILGNASSNNGDLTVNRGYSDMWVVKISNAGTLLWQRGIGGSFYDFAQKIILAQDGNYLVTGQTESNSNDITGNHGGKDIYVGKINSNTGTIIWGKCFGGSSDEIAGMYGNSFQQTSDNNYILTATTSSADGNVSGYLGGASDAWVFKIDINGNLLWQKCLGGLSLDFGGKLVELTNTNLVLLAQTGSVELPSFHGTSSNFDLLVCQLNSSGVLLTQKCYGGPNNDVPFDLVAMNDTSFVLAAKVQRNGGDIAGTHGQDEFSKDIWICDVSAAENIIWQRSLGGSRDEQQGEWLNPGLFSISNGGMLKHGKNILLNGISRSADGDVSRTNPAGSFHDYDIWLVDLDSAGKIVMQKTIGADKDEWSGGAISRVGNTNQYYLTGSTASYNNSSYLGSGYNRITDFLVAGFSLTNYIRGAVYFDNNKNGTKEVDEPFVNTAYLNIQKPSFSRNAALSSGRYDQEVDTGNFVTTCIPQHPYFATLPVSKTTVFNSYSFIDTIDFALQSTAVKRDLAIAVTPDTAVYPGGTNKFRLNYFNQGTDTVATGWVRFNKDGRAAVVNAVPAIDSTSADTLFWKYTNLLPFEHREILLTLHNADAPVLNVGDTVRHASIIWPDGVPELTPVDNRDSISQTLTSAAAANYKAENHNGMMYNTSIADTGYLVYTIFFQNNTGTPVATLRISDTLSNLLDRNSFEVINASHNYVYSNGAGNNVEFVFPGINLTAAGAGSGGFISFRIKLAYPVTLGSTVDNKASLRFDYRAPLVTATVSTILGN